MTLDELVERAKAELIVCELPDDQRWLAMLKQGANVLATARSADRGIAISRLCVRCSHRTFHLPLETGTISMPQVAEDASIPQS